MRPRRSVTPGSTTTLLSRLYPDAHLPGHPQAVTWTHASLPGWSWALRESGHDGLTWTTSTDEAVQVIFARDESASAITIDGREMRALPGDTVLAAPGSTIAVAPGMAVLHAIAAGRSGPFDHRSTHGLDLFHGHNRHTYCCASDHLAVDRWKVTEVGVLPVPESGVMAVVALYGKISLVDGGAIESLVAWESLIVTREMRMVPDGLAYLAVMYVPDREREIRKPLRDAGFADVAIAPLLP